MNLQNTLDGILLTNKTLSELDIFVRDFLNVLKAYTDYVIVSGYVTILFGRARGTEDIDIIIEKIDRRTFEKFFNDLIERNYWFLNSDDQNDLFGMLNENLAVRIAKSGGIIPNIELKFAKDRFDDFSLKESLKVEIDGYELNISPIELQIVYKLYLSGDKDIEDAIYLYEIFKERINRKTLKNFLEDFDMDADSYGIEV
jgi:predicted nucleotidyltransferase